MIKSIFFNCQLCDFRREWNADCGGEFGLPKMNKAGFKAYHGVKVHMGRAHKIKYAPAIKLNNKINYYI